MKRIALLVLVTCAMMLSLQASPVKEETARQLAMNFLNTRGTKDIQIAGLTQNSMFSNLYIFTADEGFVVMSADDCVKPILGYSLTNPFSLKDIPENIFEWLQGYDEQIQAAIDSKTEASEEIKEQWRALTTGTYSMESGRDGAGVSPLLQTQWNQTYPFNGYCPDGCVTGCVATAMAQIMKYWGQPAHGIGLHVYTHPTYGTLGADFQNTTYDWENMKNDYSSSYTQEEAMAVALLMYHCGVSVDMNYGKDASGAPSEDVEEALITYFNYQNSTQYLYRDSYTSDWTTMLKDELDAFRPILYSGRHAAGGHAFICDGYDSDGLFHFNWGWGGYCNGNYSIDNLNPSNTYNDSQAVLIGIQPVFSSVAAPANLTATYTGRQVTLQWDPADNAVSYCVYRNGVQIGVTETESFVDDPAPYGNNMYYVRSVDGDGQLSLTSNSVFVQLDYPQPIVTNLHGSKSDNHVQLSWNVPQWCPPQYAKDSLYYALDYTTNIGFNSQHCMYWGHRYTSSMLTTHVGEVVYKVSCYFSIPGTYQLFIYQGTQNNLPNQQVKNQSITVSSSGWYSFDLEESVAVEANQDLWVFIYDPEYKDYPAAGGAFASHTEGCYYTTNPKQYLNVVSGLAWLIKTYLTDGTYTYNLYDGETQIAQNISNNSYTITNPQPNSLHAYTVKTHYNSVETRASNTSYIALGSASVSTLDLGTQDRLLIPSNATLTVTGNMVSTNPNNFEMEDGSQFINSSTDVMATAMPHFSGYTSPTDGWQPLATPFTTDTEHLLATDFDLYCFDESSSTWVIKDENAPLLNETGYLYAQPDDDIIEMQGALRPSNAPVTVNLSYQSSVNTCKGFNLVGNPFPCNALVDQPYYILEEVTDNNVTESRFIQKEATVPVPPFKAILVKASAANQTVTFSPVGYNSKGEE